MREIKKVNINAFSGGGVLGYLEASIVAELDRRTNYLNDVHLFSGTSTGSIVAAALACGYEPEKIKSLFRSNAREIFKYTLLDKLKSVFGLYKSKYSHRGLKNVLQKEFGDRRLKDVPKCLLISAFDLGSQKDPYKAKYFSNFQSQIDRDLPLVDCIIASCSAPTYFPAYKIMCKIRASYRHYIDGAVACNHPAVSAIAAATDTNGLDAYPDEIACLSICAGISPRNALGWAKRGAFGWLPSIVGILLEQYSTVNYQAEKILKPDLRYHDNARGVRYRVLNPRLEKEIDMDDIKSFDRQDKALSVYGPAMRLCEDWITSCDWGRVR